MSAQNNGTLTDQPLASDAYQTPRLCFESVTFSGGDTLALAGSDVIVFVGPNNAGKSAALRELQEWIAKPYPSVVVKSATVRKVGDSAALLTHLERTALRHGSPTDYAYAGIGFNIHTSHATYFDRADRSAVAPFFTVRVSTEDRLTGSNAPKSIELHEAPPTHPIHLLQTDPDLETRLSGYFSRAFGKDLIVFNHGGAKAPLRVGKRPTLEPGEREHSASFIARLKADTVPLQEQGDGMRSFATVVLHVLATGSRSVQFLDEPEAFLHPPQARLLGELIAREREGEAQLFIATHSTDILEGLMSAGIERLRIVRIRREGDVNRVTELSQEHLKDVANSALTRFSRVFEGIFFAHVVIAESDSDCLFYNAVLQTDAVSSGQTPDVLFIHASGKHRMSVLAKTLRALDVPVSVIADIDLLREENTTRDLFTALGGNWPEIDDHRAAVDAAVTALKLPLTTGDVRRLFDEVLAPLPQEQPLPKGAESEVKKVLKSLSPWSAVKRAGRSGLPPGQAVRHFDELVRKCSQVGLWVVPVGELEGFCRSAEGSHGPGFAENVLESRDLEADPELEDARTFMRAVWAAARER